MYAMFAVMCMTRLWGIRTMAFLPEPPGKMFPKPGFARNAASARIPSPSSEELTAQKNGDSNFKRFGLRFFLFLWTKAFLFLNRPDTARIFERMGIIIIIQSAILIKKHLFKQKSVKTTSYLIRLGKFQCQLMDFPPQGNRLNHFHPAAFSQNPAQRFLFSRRR